MWKERVLEGQQLDFFSLFDSWHETVNFKHPAKSNSITAAVSVLASDAVSVSSNPSFSPPWRENTAYFLRQCLNITLKVVSERLFGSCCLTSPPLPLFHSLSLWTLQWRISKHCFWHPFNYSNTQRALQQLYCETNSTWYSDQDILTRSFILGGFEVKQHITF